MNINFNSLKTPCYVVDEKLLRKNLEILQSVQNRTGCKILLATKAFSMFYTFNIISEYLHGVTSSSLFEARLGNEEMGKEVHIYSPAYREDEFDKIMKYSDHIVFNSKNQWYKYKDKIKNFNKKISCGLRINPEYSSVNTDLYNPCGKNSRMGITLENFKEIDLDGINGLHFHTLCQNNSDALEETLKNIEEKFGKYLYNMKWLNFGGGHHITREDYDINKLINIINHIKEKYNLDIYLEPGEAIALNTGFLVTSVLDIIKNGMDIAILDTSATCHMPDVLEMPYRPEIINAKLPNILPYTYKLGAPTCLSGDVIGDYSFNTPLNIGDKLVFCDMAIYSMVKNNTFNGINLPSILFNNKNNIIVEVKTFGYQDFKGRLS